MKTISTFCNDSSLGLAEGSHLYAVDSCHFNGVVSEELKIITDSIACPSGDKGCGRSLHLRTYAVTDHISNHSLIIDITAVWFLPTDNYSTGGASIFNRHHLRWAWNCVLQRMGRHHNMSYCPYFDLTHCQLQFFLP